MKKKVLALALVVALVAIVVGTSLAYFTAEDEVTNTFTIGSVMIDIIENGKATDSDQVVFDKPMMPVVNTQDVTQDPGYAAKVVKVENTGLNAAYIRVHIAQPVELLGYLNLESDTTTGWERLDGFTYAIVDGQRYIVATYDYKLPVAPGESTSELLKGAYLVSEVDIKDNPDTPSADLEFCKPEGTGYKFSGYVAHYKVDGGYTSNTLNILVASQAIQVQGFENGTATDALNAGFGENTNPWQ